MLLEVLEMYAVIQTGGKQYRVEEGTLLEHELIRGLDSGKPVEFSKVVLLVDDSGAHAGTPYLDGAVVKGKVQAQAKSKKIVVYKYKSKTGYRRKRGHRQPFMTTLITKIEP